MSTFGRCNECKNFHRDNEKCKDIFLIYHEDYLGDKGKQIRGNSHYDAATEYADYYNTRNDYSLLDDDEGIIVEVEDMEGVRQKYRLIAERDIHYSADEIE